MGKEPGPRTIQVLDLASHKVLALPGSDGLFSPRWSPDGRWIAALTLDQKNVELFDIAQQRWKHLATTSAADPVWSPDSKSIYVHAYLADDEPILNIGMPNGAVQVVAKLSDFHNGEMANYFFGGITPTGAPLVQLRIGTGNLYAMNLDRH
jgi:WD40 repeat protein